MIYQFSIYYVTDVGKWSIYSNDETFFFDHLMTLYYDKCQILVRYYGDIYATKPIQPSFTGSAFPVP